MAELTSLMIPAIAHDGSLYPVEKLAAHQQGLLHLAVSVFVFCGDDLLIQKRAMSKYHCGGMWANTCCTHPYWGETLADSAHRRLREEMGFDLDLTPVSVITYKAAVTNDLTEHERVQVYVAHINRADIDIALNENEACDFAWANVDHLKEDVLSQPALYAPWFAIYMSRWAELGVTPGSYKRL
jgi:isopentenyl-diphosphate Delta-isomerase